MSTKDDADKVMAALERKPDLLAEIKSRLGYTPPPPGILDEDPIIKDLLGASFQAWAVLMVEHEFGQRDEGYTLFLTVNLAKAYKAKCEAIPGVPGQGWSYHLHQVLVDVHVYRRLQLGERPVSVRNSLPATGTVITSYLVSS